MTRNEIMQIDKRANVQFTYLKYDLFRYFYPNDTVSDVSLSGKIKIIVFKQAIWATAVYRLRRWNLCECRNPLLRKIISIIGEVLHLFIEVTTGIHIRPEIDIGPGLYIGHYGNIFLGGETKIGKFANISQEVTVGYAGRGENVGLPLIGDYVYIGPGAKVFGKIKIGNHAAIGANAVVTKDVPENAVAVGIPAHIINYKSSRDFVIFNHEKNKEIL